MTRGIYITANDKVIEQAIALLKSIRCYDQDTPVVLIPYDDNYQVIAKKLNEDFGVTVYPDLEFIERLSIKLQSIFGEDFFARPNQFRKQACWFGEFDEFLYIDTDIVVFKKIVDDLNYFTDYDFICYDYQHKAGIRNVFSQKIIDNKVFTEDELKGMFNGGFWASKKGLMSEEKIYQIFEECAANIDYFDFTYKTSDQPIINYMVLKNIERRFNLAHQPDKNPGNWAGNGHFQQEGYQLIDPSNNQNLHYLHWAGIKIKPGCPYWDVWKHYRYLGETAPDDAELIKTETGIKTQIFQQVKKILKGK
ncbi:Npun_R2821/Npun_R2822 family protein [Crocosphaera watsonii]|uniref:Methionine synthase II (Cobalamin-independent) n=1 Tax=Crocosphaera watsonii WH 8502 TaxID=423474 RepID=T2I944_CROWT|nr:Npun_R2821/Npun_R2822 family protein [Crocosphaera watsonii]CCQ49618.1 Methionine synthase II (cobalamin-independent) [Crocosphaera watsonii WH 8502]